MMCPQASVALSHVEARHRQSVAKLKREFPHAAPLELMGGDRICDKPNDGSGDLGDGDGTTVGSGDNVPAEGEAAVALIEWSQLEDEEKDRVRAEAQRLMAEMVKKQEAHEKAIAATRKRLEHTTTEAIKGHFGQSRAPSARASFECRVAIRLQEEHHAMDLVALEAQASPYPPATSALAHNVLPQPPHTGISGS